MPPEARGELVGEYRVRMKCTGPADQYFLGFWNFWIRDAAVDGTCGGAFFMIEEADTFGAFLGDDVIDILGERRATLAIEFPRRFAFVDSIIGTTRETRAAIDTFLGDYRGHYSAKMILF
jgi:hypothetical protein